MAYQKQTWQTGETITAQKLNHMEDGIGNNSEGNNWLIINTVNENLEGNEITRLNKTAEEIIAAYPCVLIYNTWTHDNIIKQSIDFIKGYTYDPDDEDQHIYDFIAQKSRWACNLLSEYPISIGTK